MTPGRTLYCLALVCLLASVLHSQTASTGALTVSATDPSGALVPGFNRTHRLVVNYTYDIPGNKQGKGFAGKILSGWGWGFSGLTTAQSGLPINVTDSRGGLVFAAGSARAQICPGSTYGDLSTHGSVESRLNSFYNASAICPIPVIGAVNGVGGSTGYGNLGRNVLIGPGQLNFDAAVIKKTTVGGLHENAYFGISLRVLQLCESSATYGVISTTTVSPRVIQFALRYAY